MTRINRAVELLASGQQVYYTGCGEHSYAGGTRLAQTHGDYVRYDLEHDPYDVAGLQQYMQGLADVGPARSGHRTHPVVVSLPMQGVDAIDVRVNSWTIAQILATGVHGLILCHCESPEAARAFVEAARYPFNRIGVGERLGVGRRGSGGQGTAAAIWGVPVDEYLVKADPWPLNPEGELLLGLKIENVRALERVEETMAVPGIAFAEWGPSDMSMSLGYAKRPTTPFPDDMRAARERVLAACKANGAYFLDEFPEESVIERIREGVSIGGATRAAAEIGRRFSGRTMPW